MADVFGDVISPTRAFGDLHGHFGQLHELLTARSTLWKQGYPYARGERYADCVQIDSHTTKMLSDPPGDPDRRQETIAFQFIQ